MQNTSNSQRNKWIFQPEQKPNATIRLFCFPHAGGGISAFYQWHKYFNEEIELCFIQLPGRDRRINEAPYTQLSQLIDDLIRYITPFTDKKFAFLGHSMGSLISFELTRKMRLMQNLSPIHLFLLAGSAPHLYTYEPIHHLEENDFIEEVRKFNGIDEIIINNKDIMRSFLQILKADFKLVESYNYIVDDPVDCSISVFGGISDPFVNRENLMSWKDHTTNNFKIRFFQGDHFFLKNNVDEIIRNIHEDLLMLS
jgi:medium-chain acyl-[acyl-carrier-protein] hydrolase